MKKVISFFCRMPGIYLVTAFVLTGSIWSHWDHLDERMYLTIIMSIATTFFANLYLLFIQGNGTEFTKGARWAGIMLIGLLTVVCIALNVSLKTNPMNEFPGDYAALSTLAESFAGILAWGWFSLFWNMYVYTYLPNFKAIPPNVTRERNHLLPETDE